MACDGKSNGIGWCKRIRSLKKQQLFCSFNLREQDAAKLATASSTWVSSESPWSAKLRLVQMLFFLRQFLDIYAAYSLQFFPCPDTGYGQHLPYPTFVFCVSPMCRPDTVIIQLLCVFPSDSPIHLQYRIPCKALMRFSSESIRHTPSYPLYFFPYLPGYFRQCFSLGYSHCDGYARSSSNSCYNLFSVSMQCFSVSEPVEVNEGFIDEYWVSSGEKSESSIMTRRRLISPYKV